jgi:hypothetical protein
LQISFGWLFAIIVGVFILFLAIYFTTKLIGTEETLQGAKTGKEIGILFNPLETGFETGKTTSFSLPVETRIYNKCNNLGNFGRQIIQISQKSFGEWKKTDIDIGFSNKYIFSDEPEGKEFYIFSKPFEFPFKVSDLIYLSSAADNYCFIDAPEEIKDEIEDLGQKNLLTENCSGSPGYILVCFNEEDCDVNVNYDFGFIKKNGERVYFEGDALMYAGIFSSPEIYECQLKRLMKRAGWLALLYKDKATLVSKKECDSNLGGDLLQLNNLARNFEKSSELPQIQVKVEEIKEKNKDNMKCKLW